MDEDAEVDRVLEQILRQNAQLGRWSVHDDGASDESTARQSRARPPRPQRGGMLDDIIRDLHMHPPPPTRTTRPVSCGAADVAPPLSPSPAVHVPPVRARAERFFGLSEYACAICLELPSRTDVSVLLPCLHRYHYDCARKWLREARRCPCCNTDATSLLYSIRTSADYREHRVGAGIERPPRSPCNRDVPQGAQPARTSDSL